MTDDPTTATVAVLGLPSTGKTTYLAALYHLLADRSADQIPSLVRMPDQRVYLNEIRGAWLEGRPPSRNPLDTGEHVDLDMNTASGTIALQVPDLAGESFDRLVLDRVVDEALLRHVREADGLMLFVHPENVSVRVSVSEANAMRKVAGDPPPDGSQEQDFDIGRLSAEVRVVDILQWAAAVRERRSRLVVLVSAWDEVDSAIPTQWLAQTMPMLHQYLTSSGDRYDTLVVGVSAQGGRYDESGALRRMDPAQRPYVIDPDGNRSADLTAPLQWALSR